jgi:hypothetical protein
LIVAAEHEHLPAGADLSPSRSPSTGPS